MHLVVGLGNPGSEYAGSRHNLGWMVLDAVVKQLGVGEWRTEKNFESDLVDVRSQDGERWLFVKPTTFMNNSGRAIASIAQYYKVAIGDILVIHDELDLPFGTLRIRLGGSSAGHHGIESLAYHLNNNAFWRVRCGIASTTEQRPLETSDFVLGQFTVEEQAKLPALVETAATLVKNACSSGTLQEETIVVP